MATQQELHQALGRLVSDETFRNDFARDPEGALQRAGVQLTPEQQAHLRKNVKAADLATAAGNMRLVCGDSWPNPTP